MGKVLDDRSFHFHIHSRFRYHFCLHAHYHIHSHFQDHFCLYAEVEIRRSSSPAELWQVVHLLSVVIHCLANIKVKEQLAKSSKTFFAK